MQKILVIAKLPGIDTIRMKLKDQGIQVILKDGLSLEEVIEETKRDSEIEGLVTLMKHPLNAENLEKLSHLKAISNYAVGFNNIEIEKANELKLPIGHTPDVLSDATADVALTLTLMACRKVRLAQEDVLQGLWKEFQVSRYNGVDPRDLKIGIIGFGRIGQNFARKCYRLWNVPIYTLKRASLEGLDLDFPFHAASEEEFFKNVNLLSIHCPLTDKTKNMVDRNFISKFENPFIFINTARGGIHNEEDLHTALKEGKILEVGLDVTNPEPMDKGADILKDQRVTVLPHIGSATIRTRTEMCHMAIQNVADVLLGNPMSHQANSF